MKGVIQMTQKITCSIPDDVFEKRTKAKFMLQQENKSISEILCEAIIKYADMYDETYKKV